MHTLGEASYPEFGNREPCENAAATRNYTYSHPNQQTPISAKILPHLTAHPSTPQSFIWLARPRTNLEMTKLRFSDRNYRCLRLAKAGPGKVQGRCKRRPPINTRPHHIYINIAISIYVWVYKMSIYLAIITPPTLVALNTPNGTSSNNEQRRIIRCLGVLLALLILTHKHTHTHPQMYIYIY